jgi:hypothetical protein
MEDLSSKTVAELKQYAQDNGIDLGDAKTKTKIISAIVGVQSSISAPEVEPTAIIAPVPQKGPRLSNSSSNEDGVIVVRSAEKNYPPVKAEKKSPEINNEKVAVYTSKNLHWQGVGKLKPGYNIITKEAADKWLNRKDVREASPEEVATYYGKS